VSEMLPRVEHGDDDRPIFVHACKRGPVERHTLPHSRQFGWWWDGEDTLMPSIDCHRCGTHGWWRDGQWVPA